MTCLALPFRVSLYNKSVLQVLATELNRILLVIHHEMHNIEIFKMEEPKLEIKPIAALRFVEWAM